MVQLRSPPSNTERKLFGLSAASSPTAKAAAPRGEVQGQDPCPGSQIFLGHGQS